MVEGHVTQEQGEEYLKMIQSKFKIFDQHQYTLPVVRNFLDNHLLIFRGNNSAEAHGRALYIMNFDLGLVTPLNFALATMFEVLFEKELKLRFCVTSMLAQSARTRIAIISDHLILQLMVMGVQHPAKFEIGMEHFIAGSFFRFTSSINEDFLERWKNIAATRLNLESQSVKEYALHDADDLYTTSGKYSNLREKAAQIIKTKVTQDDLTTFVKKNINEGKRLALEMYNGPDFKTYINSTSTDPDLKKSAAVMRLFDVEAPGDALYQVKM